MPKPSAIASGTLRCGLRTSPAKSTAVRKPSKQNKIPPLPTAASKPVLVSPAVGVPTAMVRLPQWRLSAIKTMATTNGTINFQIVIESIQRARLATPRRLIQVNSSIKAMATAKPKPLST